MVTAERHEKENHDMSSKSCLLFSYSIFGSKLAFQNLSGLFGYSSNLMGSFISKLKVDT